MKYFYLTFEVKYRIRYFILSFGSDDKLENNISYE